MNLLKILQTILPRGWLLATVGILLLTIAPPVARAYVLADYQWPSGQDIELDLQLGNPNGTLIDGATTWDQVVVSAAAIWNPYLGSGVQFSTRETNFTPAQRDGKNSVFFSASVFGEGFGDDTLATTVTFYNSQTHAAGESDVVFNVAQTFNSYRGLLRRNGGTTVYDLRRVALHELGHALGLAHVTQGTQAIMEPDITDLDTLQPDDIAGVESIYGSPAPISPAINEGLNSGGEVGEKFEYLISATNRPTSFQAGGLPAGLSLNTVTGLISGVPTVAGTYDIVIGATNTAGAGTATLHLVFSETIKITGDLNLSAYVGRPYYYQVATSGQPTSFQPLNGPLPAGLSLDPYTGLISGTPNAAGSFRFQVQATDPNGSDEQIFELVVAYDATLSTVQQAGRLTALLEASDGNFYGTTENGGQALGGTVIRITPGGTMTTLYTFDSSVLHSPDDPGDLHQAPGGSFYGTTMRGGANFAGTIFKLTADGTMTTLVDFPGLPPDSSTDSTALLGRDGNYYSSVRPFIAGIRNPGGWIYKVTPDGTLSTLYTFNGTDGFYPSGLIQGEDGNFYGTTYAGGSNGLGTLFKITPDGTLTFLHHFAASEGTQPLTPLIQATDGNFYGTTSAGGAGNGTVFKMTPDGTLTTLHTFVAGEGNRLTTSLAQGSDGALYGAASGSYVGLSVGLPDSILFELTLDGTLTTLHHFASNEGAPTSLPLVPDGAGNFFGVASGGINNYGGYSDGAVFKETPSAVPLVYAPPPSVLPTVTLEAAIPQVTAGSGEIAEFMLGPSAVQNHDVTVSYTVKGTAISGVDYVMLTGTKKIKAGKLSKPIKIIPQGDLGGASKKTVVLTLGAGDGYIVGTTDKVKVKVLAP